MVQKAFLIFFAILFGTYLSSVEAEEKSDLLKKAESMLSKEDTVYLTDTAIPFIYNHFGDARLTELLRAVWNVDKKRLPDLAWKSLTDDEVKLKFANLWAQWIRETQKDKGEIQAIRTFVLPFRQNQSANLRMAAVAFTVGGNDKDVEALSDIVLNDQRPIAATAVYSIVEIQGKRAVKTLSDLQTKVRDPSLKEVIARAIKDAESSRFNKSAG